MFRTVSPSIIRSLRLYIQHWNVIQVLWLFASGNEMELQYVQYVQYDAVCTVLDS
jgi:hypothetical protein